MINKEKQHSFSPEILSTEDIKNRLEQAMSDEDKTALREYTIEQLVDNLAYLAPFAASPATFDLMAFTFCCDLNNSEAA